MITDSESATLFAWASAVESVNDIDSERFTPSVFDIKSVKLTDSDRFTSAVFEI